MSFLTVLTRMIRSLAFAAQNFGMAPPGVYTSSIRGTEIIDGTIFVRVRTFLRFNIDDDS